MSFTSRPYVILIIALGLVTCLLGVAVLIPRGDLTGKGRYHRGIQQPWWSVPHPNFKELNASSPVFPAASAELQATAVMCLRNEFAGNVSQDRKIYSQVGEDGILESVFKCIGVTDKQYVEFGVEDGKERSTRWLAEGHGFSGLLMDGGNTNPAINLQQEMIFAETISDVLHKHKAPFPTMDHMTIDIDQNTWHVALAVMRGGWRPRSLTVEMNRNLLPHQSYAVVYDKDKMWQTSTVFGGSPLAFDRMLGFYGYQLMAQDRVGVNMFFVHNSTLGPSPEQVHETTSTWAHPLYQVFDRLHEPDQGQTWVEVPEGVDFQTWDPSKARHVVLNHVDRSDGIRVFYEATAGEAPQEQKADTEFARYLDPKYRKHDRDKTVTFWQLLHKHIGAKVDLFQGGGAPV